KSVRHRSGGGIDGGGELTEIHCRDDTDEHPEQQDELALRRQVRLAGLVDEIRDLEHRLVDRQALEASVNDEREEQSRRADDQSIGEQRLAAHTEELDAVQIRN